MAQRYYSKPTSGERLWIFGDGDEAIFDTVDNSSIEGYYHIKLRPTMQMRWKKQIPESHYNPNDRWIHKIYKKDLCIQLSFSPDFPVWICLCDYIGNEDTPMMKNFIKCEDFIRRNRELEKDKKIAESEVNTLKKLLRKKVQHPDEIEHEKLVYMDRINKVKSIPQQFSQQFPQQIQERTQY